jgi:hypothetical protein
LQSVCSHSQKTIPRHITTQPVPAGVQGIVATKDAVILMAVRPVRHAAMELFAQQTVIKKKNKKGGKIWKK